MMDKNSIFPCVRTRRIGERILATIGMKLEALLSIESLEDRILDETLRPMDGQTDLLTWSLWDASLKLVQNLISWGQNTFAEIHWTSWPNLEFPARGRLDITLTLTSVGNSEMEAKEEVLTRYLPFQGLLFSHIHWATFIPICDLESLDARVEPFIPRHSLALVRRAQRLSLTLPLPLSTPAIGFLPEERIGEESEKGGTRVNHLFPWAPSLDPLHRLVDFLLWYPEPVRLVVRLQLHPRPGRENELLLKTVQGCQELLASSLKPETVLERQAATLRNFSLQRMSELGQGMVRLSAYVASRGPLDEAMVQTLASSFLGSGHGEGADHYLRGGASLMRVAPGQMKDCNFSADERAFSYSEAACLFRLPWPPKAEIPGLPLRRWRSAFANLPEMGLRESSIVLLGLNIHRGIIQPVHVRVQDRLRHMYIVGQTGTGKSTILENLLLQDIYAGRGLCLIDPHGELVDAILSQYPLERKEDLILIDLTDSDFPFALNLLKWESPEERDRIIDDLYRAIDRMYDLKETGGPIFEKHFRGMLRLLMGEGKHDFIPTLLELPMLYARKDFRNFCRKKIDDEEVHLFLLEVEKVHGECAIENLSMYITSKISRFSQDSRLRRIFGQEGLSIDFPAAIDQGKVVLINLGRGIFGETVSALVANQIVGRFKAAAMGRNKVFPEKRRDFFLYVDEFQNLVHENFADLLSEARKYRMGLILANQYTEQLRQEWVGRKDGMLSSILGNVGIILAFRLGVEDSKRLAEIFLPTFSAHDLMELPNWEGYMKVHLGGKNIPAFNLQTIKPQDFKDSGNVTYLKKLNGERYCRLAKDMDKKIKAR